MSSSNDLAVLIERWFTDRLMRHRGVSSNTIASYRDTFRLLFAFAQTRLGRSPSQLTLRDLDAPFIGAFLEDLKTLRSASVRTRNLRLTAIRSFFRYASFEEPAHSAQIQRVLAIPSKRCDKRQLQFLTRPEIKAILACPDRSTWLGRRDHTLLLLAAQTGLRVSEIIDLDRDAGARCSRAMRWQGPQGAKYAAHQGCTAGPFGAGSTSPGSGATALFPNMHGGKLSADGVQALLNKYVAKAREHCVTLRSKRVSPHVLRHSAAMELQAGVDCSVIALWVGHEAMETTLPIFTHIWSCRNPHLPS